MKTTFEDWLGGRTLHSYGTNHQSDVLPFQSWVRFKEAFAPEFIQRAIAESPIPVHRCLDPFAGSGTTGLACQFLGKQSVLVEVNPLLADLAEAKLSEYHVDRLRSDFESVASHKTVDPPVGTIHGPLTMVEPGLGGRWIFDRAVADQILSLRSAIESVKEPSHRRLFRVLLAGLLVDVSNIRVSGKGRRYRSGWREIWRDEAEVLSRFEDRASRAIAEIDRFSDRRSGSYELVRGDARVVLANLDPVDIAIFSPPYPNSFDYTDIYNVELWVLGYLKDYEDNRALRSDTLRSHVQVRRDYGLPPTGSLTLETAVARLTEARESLWDRSIPEMVGAYFSDVLRVLTQTKALLASSGTAWMVVGDSRYAGIHVDTAKILAELASTEGWSVETVEPFRSMRASPQQGGAKELSESLVVLST